MKKKNFIRTLSPITITVVSLLDIATIVYGVFSIAKVIELKNSASIFFLLCELFAIVIAILVSKEVLSNGIEFKEDEIEFIGLDNDNTFKYEEIEKVEIYQDTNASLVKNFNDRHALIILTLKDDKMCTLDIGLITRKTLKNIIEKIAEVIGDDKVNKNNKAISVTKNLVNDEKDNKDK